MKDRKTRLRGIDEFREEDTLAAWIDQRRVPNDAVEAKRPPHDPDSPTPHPDSHTHHTDSHTRAPGDEIYPSGKRWSRSKTVALIVGLVIVAFFGIILGGRAEALVVMLREFLIG